MAFFETKLYPFVIVTAKHLVSPFKYADLYLQRCYAVRGVAQRLAPLLPPFKSSLSSIVDPFVAYLYLSNHNYLVSSLSRMSKRDRYSSIPEYETDSDSDTPLEPPPKRKPRTFEWEQTDVFQCGESARDYMAGLKGFSKHYTKGNSVLYRCNAAKRRGQQCDKVMKLYYHETSEQVTLYETKSEHTCQDLPKKNGLSDEAKARINELSQQGKKAKAIQAQLIEDGIPVLNKRQIETHLRTLNTNKLGPTSISLGELEKWCEDNSTPPSDPHQPYVFGHEVCYDEPSFCFAVTSPRLLEQSQNTDHLCVDATYKIVWEGFPLLVFGRTDRNRSFHLIAAAMTSDEKMASFYFVFDLLKKEGYNPNILISDAANAIRNAFTHVFGEESILKMCWTHMRTNVEKYLNLVEQEHRKDIVSDLDSLQLCPDVETFTTGKDLFVKKWSALGQSRFLDYMNGLWFSSHINWFEGVEPASMTPSTNNALESFNNTIKKEFTLRQKMPVARFRTTFFKMVEKISKTYDSTKKIATTPALPHALWVKSYQWARSNKPIKGKVPRFTVPAGDRNTIPPRRKKFASFENFVENIFSSWTIEMNADAWEEGRCTCPEFLKQNICKHILGSAIRLKLVDVPTEAKAVPIGEKPKRGRPKKATKALLR